jgi:predicted RNase H-like HicB family nuclease
VRDRQFSRNDFRAFPNAKKEDKVIGMKFVTTLERDEDGVWIAECPSIPGCVSQGDSRDQALANIREAIAACLEVRAERGLPLTIETQQVEVAI